MACESSDVFASGLTSSRKYSPTSLREPKVTISLCDSFCASQRYSRLVEDDDGGRIQLASIDCAPCGDTKALSRTESNHQQHNLTSRTRQCTHKRNVGHAEHDDSSVFCCVLCRLAEMSLDDVVAVQEWHLSVRLDPDLFEIATSHQLPPLQPAIASFPSQRTLFLAYRPIKSNAVTCNRNFSVFENFPKQTPREMRLARGTEIA